MGERSYVRTAVQNTKATVIHLDRKTCSTNAFTLQFESNKSEVLCILDLSKFSIIPPY